MMKISDEFNSFIGKKNIAITLLISPKENLENFFNRIERRVNAMKHKTKKKQVLQVINHIRWQNQNRVNFDGNGMIICAGLNQNNQIVYHLIESPYMITLTEYHYGYNFNLERIQEIINSDIFSYIKEDQEENEIRKLIDLIKNDQKQITIGDKELLIALNCGILDKIYYCGHHELDDYLIEGIRQCQGKIIKIRNADLLIEYGEIIGHKGHAVP